MRRLLLFLLATAAGSSAAHGQVVSEWRTPAGVPVAVVEVTGGDVEHFAALVPSAAAAPEAVAGFPVEVRPRRSGQLWAATVPSLSEQPALTDFLAAISRSGAASLVILGAVPAREMQAMGAAIDAVPARTAPRAPCVLAEGAVAERAGTDESAELAIALPPPDDPRSDLVPALLALLRSRLAAGFPDGRVSAESQDGCSRMVFRVPARDEHPRLVLRRLRQALAQLPTIPVSGDELARAVAASQERAGQTIVDGASVARELAERLAFGGSTAAAFATPALDAATIAEFARQVLSGHPGSATLLLRERRPETEPPRTLENGVEVTTSWIPGETGVVALALGGIAPRAGGEILTAAATAAVKQGWPAVVVEIAGVPTLAVAVPASGITDAIERTSESLSSARPVARDDLEADVSRSLGLADLLTAETLSVALALPPEADVGDEAVDKFFGGFASGRVTTGVAHAGPGLRWTVREGAPEIVGLVDLPPSATGLVCWQLLHERLARENGVRTAAFAPPGRLLLAVMSEGGADVPALDGRLAALWKGVARPASSNETAAAVRRALTTLYGDTARAAARAAAAAFLPSVPTQPELLEIDAARLNKVIAALPGWDALTRFARGAEPPPPARPARKGGVRKSPSPQRDRR